LRREIAKLSNLVSISGVFIDNIVSIAIKTSKRVFYDKQKIKIMNY